LSLSATPTELAAVRPGPRTAAIPREADVAQVVIDGWRLSPAILAWGAEQTVRMHREEPTPDRPTAGRCNRCPTDGSVCEEFEMASDVIATLAQAPE
jgi:hypothetical protein